MFLFSGKVRVLVNDGFFAALEDQSEYPVDTVDVRAVEQDIPLSEFLTCRFDFQSQCAFKVFGIAVPTIVLHSAI